MKKRKEQQKQTSGKYCQNEMTKEFIWFEIKCEIA